MALLKITTAATMTTKRQQHVLRCIYICRVTITWIIIFSLQYIIITIIVIIHTGAVRIFVSDRCRSSNFHLFGHAADFGTVFWTQPQLLAIGHMAPGTFTCRFRLMQ